MKLRQIIQDYFTFNRRERKGVLLLMFIIGGIIVYVNLQKYFAPEFEADFSEFKNEIARFEAAQKKIDEERKSKYKNDFKRYSKQSDLKLFSFDPNNLSPEQWKKLGLKDWQIKIIHNYEAKGGRFRKKEDLKKIYGISSHLYHNLEPYILLPEKPVYENEDWKEDIYKPYEKKKKERESYYENLVIDLNTADTTELKKLRGIGSYFSKAIVKYRDLLGGYNHIEQLKEVYRLNPEVVNSIAGHLVVNISNLKKINVNRATVKELKSHPYINWNVANLIVNYRERHGRYQALEDIKKTDLVDENLYLKIAPYLEL